MKAYPERGKWIKDILYVDLWPACDANMKIWKVKLEGVLDELKDTFAGRWHGVVGTLVNGVHDKVDGALIGECKHLFKTSCQNGDTRLFLAFIMIGMKT